MTTSDHSGSLEFADVSFAYRRGVRALDGLTATLCSRLTCVLGPNGAGKSTFFGVATGQLLPRTGSVRIGELMLVPSTRRAWARHIGWTPQHVPVAPGMTVREQVRYVAWLHGLSRSQASTAADEAIEAVGLQHDAHRRVASLSGGQRRRVGIASGISHRPAFAFLDEPTAGLDAEQRDRFRSLLQRASEHTRIVVSTHQTEDLDQVFEAVLVISEGRALFQGTVNDFVSRPWSAASGRPGPVSVEAAYIDIVRNTRRDHSPLA